MAVKSGGGRRMKICRNSSENSIFSMPFKNPKACFASALLIFDLILVSLIVAYVPYTKIDWDAYMSQVSGFLGGERNYEKLEGDTGPLVYHIKGQR